MGRSCSIQKIKSLRLTRVMRWRGCWREEPATEEPAAEPEDTWRGGRREEAVSRKQTWKEKTS